MTVEDLIKSGRKFKRDDFIFFWGRGPNEGCFSQWERSPFVIDQVLYKTAEHWMMAEKARLFGDKESLVKIIECRTPEIAKKIGRQVKGWEQNLWDDNKYDIVVKGNIAKFSQNPAIKNYLLSTGDKIIVESSKYDPIWGIGMSAEEEGVENPKNWKGQNLLGFAIMETRSFLINKGD